MLYAHVDSDIFSAVSDTTTVDVAFAVDVDVSSAFAVIFHRAAGTNAHLERR